MQLTPAPQVPVLDSFRGFAAVGILLYHCWLLTGEPRRRSRRCAQQRPAHRAAAFAFAGAVVGLAVAPAAPSVRAAPARWLGTVSYGVFLAHYPLLLLARTTLDFEHDGSRAAFVALTAFALPTSLVVAWLSWVAIERPARRWARGAGHGAGSGHGAVATR